MPIDASIYGNIQAPQVNIPSPLATAESAMRLSQLGMQQMAQQRQMQTQQLVQGAMVQHTDPTTGQLDHGGFLSTLGKSGPLGQMAAMDYGHQFAQQEEAKAKAQAAHVDAADKALGVLLPHFDYMKTIPEDQKANAWSAIRQSMADKGADVSRLPDQWDAQKFKELDGMLQTSKPHYEQLTAAANLNKLRAENVLIPQLKSAELADKLYGRAAPNPEISRQYADDAKAIKSSQMYMQQMHENYKNPSPPGDASMIINAFKIKNPNAPDVNSLDELAHSQSAGDKWRNMAAHAIEGGIDQSTRDNLMRDAGGAFMSNVKTLRGIQEKYTLKANDQGTPGAASIVAEPAIDRTHAETEGVLKNIGPYVPPSQRGGVMGTINKFAAKIAGVGPSAANAGASIRMIGPDGKARMIPISQKGEAIAAGGRVAE